MTKKTVEVPFYQPPLKTGKIKIFLWTQVTENGMLLYKLDSFIPFSGVSSNPYSIVALFTTSKKSINLKFEWRDCNLLSSSRMQADETIIVRLYANCSSYWFICLFFTFRSSSWTNSSWKVVNPWPTR